VSPPGRLDGRTCLIVGGTSGIGLAAARRFLKEGARVVVAGRLANAQASAIAQLVALGPAWEHDLDLSLGEPEVAGLFDFALDALGGRLDILLHVAGVSGRRFGDGPLHECSSGGWERVMQINAMGLFLTNRQAVRHMLLQPLDAVGLRGTIVNVGSVLDRSPAPAHFGTIAYAASKGAVRALTLASAARYASDRIRFNLLAPGLIDTPMAARAVNDPEIRSYLATKQPIAGGPGTAEDVAEAALYLCEPGSRLVTGAEITVDGGWCVSEGGRGGEPAHAASAGPVSAAFRSSPHEARDAPPPPKSDHLP
jgi:NAD(P)-dependent dehydrogenase (short-subunit alcohol dehydrogenase family)